MPAEKSDAIVIRVTEFSETSCVMTLFTRDFGKITGLAKGARRRKSPFESALDVLSVIRVVFLHKNTEAMDLLTEAKLERRFRSASTDWDRLNCAYYVAELLNILTGNSDSQPEIFRLADQAILDLDRGPTSPFLTLARFEFQLLQHLGHAPMLENCVSCGSQIPLEDRKYFGVLAGGLYCALCRSGKTSVVTLSPEAWVLLTELSQEQSQWEQPEAMENGESVCENLEPFATVSRNRSPGTRLSQSLVALPEVRETMNQFVAHLTGKRPRLQAFLKLPPAKH